MFPILLFVGLASFIAWAARPKTTGIVSPPPPKLLSGVPTAVGKFQDSSTPAGFLGPPIQPEEERLLTLLVLWAKDKKFEPGKKRFMTAGLAAEAARIAMRLGLVGTARAVMSDGPIPAHENLGRRGITVRRAVVEFASGRKLPPVGDFPRSP
jgi:hypothetical protein